MKIVQEDTNEGSKRTVVPATDMICKMFLGGLPQWDTIYLMTVCPNGTVCSFWDGKILSHGKRELVAVYDNTDITISVSCPGHKVTTD